MKFITVLLSRALLVATCASASQALAAEENKPSQTITRAGTQASIKGSPEFFTGSVRVDPLFAATDSAPFSGAYVNFEPGARSAWHKGDIKESPAMDQAYEMGKNV